MFTINALGSIRSSRGASVRNCFYCGAPANKSIMLQGATCSPIFNVSRVFSRVKSLKLWKFALNFPPRLLVDCFCLKSQNRQDDKGQVESEVGDHYKQNKNKLKNVKLKETHNCQSSGWLPNPIIKKNDLTRVTRKSISNISFRVSEVSSQFQG